MVGAARMPNGRVAPSAVHSERHYFTLGRAKDMTCELHDEVSAGSQFVTHLTGRILERLSLRTTPINTKVGLHGHCKTDISFGMKPSIHANVDLQGFESLLQLVDNTCADSFDLFFARLDWINRSY